MQITECTTDQDIVAPVFAADFMLLYLVKGLVVRVEFGVFVGPNRENGFSCDCREGDFAIITDLDAAEGPDLYVTLVPIKA